MGIERLRGLHCGWPGEAELTCLLACLIPMGEEEDEDDADAIQQGLTLEQRRE